MKSSSNNSEFTEHLQVAVIGGGQAGLSVSYLLKQQGMVHRVFERYGIAHEWRNNRWDSFCLVTPNWQCRLPGFPYPGDDPHGFMLRDQIIDYIEAYVASFAPPLELGVSVLRVSARDEGGFDVLTSKGRFTADQIVVATGGYHTPSTPRLAERLDAGILQLHSSEYRNPQSLREGAVLVVGTGQSGCQIAEDLHLAGRKVHLSVGSAPKSPRFHRGRDVTDWLTDSGYYDIPIAQHPQKESVRDKTNHYLTGRDGGREIDLRRFALEGMRLHGRLKDLKHGRFSFHDDLAQNLESAEKSADNIRKLCDQYIAACGIDAPEEPAYQPPWQPEPGAPDLDCAVDDIGCVIWSIGFGTDYGWLEAPVFDGRGRPVHDRGVTTMPGVYFLGLPWQNTWGSGRFSSVGDDASYLMQYLLAHQARPMLVAS